MVDQIKGVSLAELKSFAAKQGGSVSSADLESIFNKANKDKAQLDDNNQQILSGEERNESYIDIKNTVDKSSDSDEVKQQSLSDLKELMLDKGYDIDSNEGKELLAKYNTDKTMDANNKQVLNTRELTSLLSDYNGNKLDNEKGIDETILNAASYNPEEEDLITNYRFFTEKSKAGNKIMTNSEAEIQKIKDELSKTDP